MRDFAGGIYDGDARAFIFVAGAVAAIDIGAGRLLWRRAGLGRPVAATAARLVTLATEGKAFSLHLVDAVTGADIARLTDFGMPDLAAEVGILPDAVTVDCEDAAQGLLLSWHIRRPYRGGAPPPAQVAAQMGGEISGTAMLDLETATIRPVGALPVPTREKTAPAAMSTTEPDVLALDQIGDKEFALKAMTESGTTKVSLVARTVSGKNVLWEVPLSQDTAVPPSPLRKSLDR